MNGQDTYCGPLGQVHNRLDVNTKMWLSKECAFIHTIIILLGDGGIHTSVVIF